MKVAGFQHVILDLTCIHNKLYYSFRHESLVIPVLEWILLQFATRLHIIQG
jgi:hypothetical protein